LESCFFEDELGFALLCELDDFDEVLWRRECFELLVSDGDFGGLGMPCAKTHLKINRRKDDTKQKTNSKY